LGCVFVAPPPLPVSWGCVVVCSLRVSYLYPTHIAHAHFAMCVCGGGGGGWGGGGGVGGLVECVLAYMRVRV